MVRILLLVVVAGSLLLAYSGNVLAFDGKRSGFMFGGGIGLGGTTLEESAIRSSGTYNTFNLNLKIGTGLSEKVNLYWAIKLGFYSRDDSLHGQGLVGPGVSYYLKKTSPSPYLSAAISTPTSDSENGNGNGFAIGTGYEFTKFFSFEAYYIKQDFATSIGFTLISMKY